MTPAQVFLLERVEAQAYEPKKDEGSVMDLAALAAMPRA